MDDEEEEESPESPTTNGGQEASGPGYSQQDLSSYYEVSEGQGGQSEQVNWSAGAPSHPGPPVTPPGDVTRCETDQLSPHNTTQSSGYGSETGSPDCPATSHGSRVPETELGHAARRPETESPEHSGHLSHNIRDLMNQWNQGYNMLHPYAGHGWSQGHHHHPQYHLGFGHGYHHLSSSSQPEHHK